MEEKIKRILEKLNEINYGWIDDYGVIHKKAGKEYFINNYHVQSIENTIKYKIGTCWEQTELARYYAENENISSKDSYIIIYNDESKIARHSILIVNNNIKDDMKYYVLESSWNKEIEIISYKSVKEIIDMYINKFPKMYKIYDFNIEKIEVYKYIKPDLDKKYTFEEFTKYCKNQERILDI